MTITHVQMYNLSELRYGPDRGFAGYIDYQRIPVANFDPASSITDFRRRQPKSTASKPKRRNPNNQALDTSLVIVSESVSAKYVIVLGEGSGVHFPANDPILLLLAGGAAGSFLSNIDVLDNGQAVSFDFDADAAKNSSLGQAISSSNHGNALRVPICFNLVDQVYGFPEWAIDDFRFQPDSTPATVPDPESAYLNTFSHGGVHPDEFSGMSHGGVHPPGASTYIVVELP